jgi:hypothetical protein
MTQTWNAGGVTFTGVKLNVTDTASAADSLVMDLQVAGSSKMRVSKTDGTVMFGANSAGWGASVSGTTVTFGRVASSTAIGTASWGFANNNAGDSYTVTGSIAIGTAVTARDLILYRDAPAVLQLGADTSTNGATAVAQRIKGPDASGTTSTGGSMTIAGGTGTSAGGAVILATSATTGAPAAALTVNNNAVATFAKPPVLPVYTVATLPATAAAGMVQGAIAIVTDALVPTYLGALTGGGAVVTPVFYNGSAWIAY